MQSKKDDILTAALQVFQEEGLKGARMERIAEVAAVSKRTLYKYFDSKAALFEAISAMTLKVLSDMEIPNHDPKAPLAPQLTEALRAYMRQTMTPDFLTGSRVLQSEFMRNPEAAQRFNAAYREVDVPLTRFVADAMAAGQLIPADPDAATARLLALFKSMILIPAILNSVGTRDSEDMDSIARESVQQFLMQFASPVASDS